MNRSLFPTSYDEGFESVWKLYRSRAEMPSCMRKSEGYAAWIKTRNLRPELPIMLASISLYLDQLESTKRVRNNGRDSKVEYHPKLHLSTYLNKLAWQDFQERATASLALAQIPATEAQKPTQRRVISGEYYLASLRNETPVPLKPWRQILAERHKAPGDV